MLVTLSQEGVIRSASQPLMWACLTPAIHTFGQQIRNVQQQWLFFLFVCILCRGIACSKLILLTYRSYHHSKDIKKLKDKKIKYKLDGEVVVDRGVVD